MCSAVAPSPANSARPRLGNLADRKWAAFRLSAYGLQGQKAAVQITEQPSPQQPRLPWRIQDFAQRQDGHRPRHWKRTGLVHSCKAHRCPSCAARRRRDILRHVGENFLDLGISGQLVVLHPRSHVLGRDRATRGSSSWQSPVEKCLSRNPTLTGNHLVGVEPQLCNETILVRKVMHKGAECRKIEDCYLSTRSPKPVYR